MDPTVSAAIISSVGAFVGGIIVAIIARMPVQSYSSRKVRQRMNVPEIMKTKWQADWYYEDGNIFVSDTVTFEKWERGPRFSGYGEVVHDEKQFKYSIEGEISPGRTLILSYKAEKFPSQANIGTACLELSSGADKLEGLWAGTASKKQPDGTTIHTIRGGRLKMHLIKKLE
jgi:hypothetical protein